MLMAQKDGYSGWSKRLMYFTGQSNLWIGFTQVFLVTALLSKREKYLEKLYFLRYIFTVAITVTGIVFCRGITVEDVISHLGVSRRLAYLRFAQYGRQSIRREIEKCRLEKVRYYLKSSRLPVGRISILCGYENPHRLMYVFKSSTGMTMTEYRRAHSANSCKGMPPPVKTISGLHA